MVDIRHYTFAAITAILLAGTVYSLVYDTYLDTSDPLLALERVDNGLTLIDTWDVTFAGHDGSPIRAWYNRPAGVEAELPVVVEYLGYGGGRDRPRWTAGADPGTDDRADG